MPVRGMEALAMHQSAKPGYFSREAGAHDLV